MTEILVLLVLLFLSVWMVMIFGWGYLWLPVSFLAGWFVCMWVHTDNDD